MYRILVSVVLALSCLCPITVQQEDTIPSSYFPHERDGNSGASSRIVGGEEVQKHAYPFAVALMIHKGMGNYFCGGSLISNNFVLTAARCVAMNPDYIDVDLGYHDMNSSPEGVEIRATDFVIHKNYNERQFLNNVALVRLPHNVTFNDYIKPVQLAKGTDTYEGDRATMLGWGQTETQAKPAALKSVNAIIMSNADCAQASENFQKLIAPSHICTSGSGNVGLCARDSGDPLIVNGIQVGIASFDTVNCTAGLPSGFTRVTEFYDWIAENSRYTGGATGLHGLQMAVVLIVSCFPFIFFN